MSARRSRRDLRYLLDTNVLSEPTRPDPSARLLERFHKNARSMATASLVLHELLFGCARLPESHRRRMLERYVDEVVAKLPLLPYDGPAARWHARERARLHSVGSPAPFVDGQIAAIAVVHGLVLVTANAADFDRFDGLRVENWLE